MILPGQTVFLRATALEHGPELTQVVIDDGKRLSVTLWVPTGECARFEDIGHLKPIRRDALSLTEPR